MPFSLSPVAWVAIIGMLLSAAYWGIDKIGNIREAEVWQKINVAIKKTNDDIGEQNTIDDRIAALQEAARNKALDNAGKIADHCMATPTTADALSRVK